MRVLGFDTETTGLDPKTAHILEMGAVMFDVTDGVWSPIAHVNELIHDERIYPLNPEAQAINGITEEMLRASGVSFKDALIEVVKLGIPDFVIAHNAQYDKDMFRADCTFNQIHSVLLDVPWLCSRNDIEHAPPKTSGLAHLALDYHVVVDPSKLHRASADVELMGAMLSAAKANPSEMKAYKDIPLLVISTPTEKPWLDGGVSNSAAKEAGYRYESANFKIFKNKWVKTIRQNKLAEEKLPYTIIEEVQIGW